MDGQDKIRIVDALADEGLAEVGEVHTFVAHHETKGKLYFEIVDRGTNSIPRWAGEVRDDESRFLGSDAEDSLSIVLRGLFNKL